jgi:hypothetical protein
MNSRVTYYDRVKCFTGLSLLMLFKQVLYQKLALVFYIAYEEFLEGHASAL